MTLRTSAVAVCCCNNFGEIVGALAQLVEEPGILDGDNRLRSEIPDQIDLFVGECLDVLSVDGDGANQLIVLEHRNAQQGAGATGIDKPNEGRRTFGIGRLRPKVGDMDKLPGAGDTPEGRLRLRVNEGFTAPLFDMRCWSMRCHGPESSVFAKPHDAELRLADTRGVLQHGLEHRVQLAWRARDHA